MEGQVEAAEASREAEEARDPKGAATDSNSTGDPHSSSEAYKAGGPGTGGGGSEDAGTEQAQEVEEGQAASSKRRGRRRTIFSTLTQDEFKAIEDALDELELEGNERNSGLILFGIIYGSSTDADGLAKWLKLDRAFVRLRMKRLRENGVIVGARKLRMEWLNEDWRVANVSFILDILVAEGYATRELNAENKPVYQTTKVADEAIAVT